MARIQILELPEGAADERPPFALIIDQVEDAEALGDLTQTRDLLEARAILVFEGETVEIPANAPLPTPNAEQGIPLGSTYQVTIDGVPLVWEAPQSEWDEARTAAAHAVQRVRDLSERPDSPDWPESEGYLNGYAAAIRAAKRALVEPPPTETADG